MYNRNIRYGINVRGEYATMIALGNKIIETRSKNMLKNLIGQRVYIVKTNSKSRAYIIGEVTIERVKEYNTIEEFDNDLILHMVDESSEFHPSKSKKYIDSNGNDTNIKKYGYVLSNPVYYYGNVMPVKYGLGDNYAYRRIDSSKIITR